MLEQLRGHLTSEASGGEAGSQARPAADRAGIPQLSETMQLTWQQPRGMIQLSIVNFVLRICTLGLYNFWGKTEARARIWSGLRINGEPLVYGGSGWELLAGFAIAMVYVVIPYSAFFGSQFYFGPKHPATIAVTYAFLLVISWMWSVAAYRARRFRLTRTTWRGVHGDLTGSANAYAWTALWTMLIVIVSNGWAYPWRQTKLQQLLVANTTFGDQKLTFSASSDVLYAPFALLWFGGLMGILIGSGIVGGVQAAITAKTMPASALVPASFAAIAVYLLCAWLAGAWYQTRSFNHYLASTRVDGVSFEGSARAAPLLWLGLTNSAIAFGPLVMIGIISIGAAVGFGVLPALPSLSKLDTTQTRALTLAAFLSVGLFAPYLQARTARFWLGHVALKGCFASGPLLQAVRDDSKQGEGLAQAFDIDVF